MTTTIRIGTFNLENFDDQAGQEPSLATRIAIMRPQLERMRADILCLQEVNSQGAGANRNLEALEQLISGTAYQNYACVFTTPKDSTLPFDVRNLVILSRFPILSSESIYQTNQFSPSYRRITAILPETQAQKILWERPILSARIDLGNNVVLQLFNVHLKSKIPSDIPGQKDGQYVWLSDSAWAEGMFISSMKQFGQAIQLRSKVDELFNQAEAAGFEPLIAIGGDFNAEPESIPLSALRGPVEETGNPALTQRVLVPCENTVPASSRYSLFHLGQGQMIDHILASRALLTYYHTTEIHNEVLPDESGAFRTDVQFPESDHAPVVAEFLFP